MGPLLATDDWVPLTMVVLVALFVLANISANVILIVIDYRHRKAEALRREGYDRVLAELAEAARRTAGADDVRGRVETGVQAAAAQIVAAAPAARVYAGPVEDAGPGGAAVEVVVEDGDERASARLSGGDLSSEFLVQVRVLHLWLDILRARSRRLRGIGA